MNNNRLKFRAKRIDNNQFAIGYLCFIYVDDVKKGRIYSPQDCYSYDVDVTTLGQCTGLKDKNGKLIYEGDIVDCGTLCKWIVIWFTNRFILVPSDDYQDKDKFACDRKNGFAYFENNHRYPSERNVVIGNIYENKELLQESEAN